MARTPKNQGKEWTNQDLQKLKHMASIGKVTPIIAYELQRSEDAIRHKASEKDISLKPTNQKPNKKLKK